MRKRLGIIALVVGCLLVLGSTAAVAGHNFDFGVTRDHDLARSSKSLFGVKAPLSVSSTQSLSRAEALADPTRLATLASGLQAHVVTTRGPAVDDQITLWPDDEHATHLIVCNEQGPSQPGLVRIELATGNVSTIVTGTTSCDPTRRTPWGTILFGEESGTSGQLYELVDPINTTNVMLDRTTGFFTGGTGASNLVRRDALGRAAFEGIGILDDGTTYLDPDDSGFGPKNGGPGDAYFKFIPSQPFTGNGPITDLSQSPYAAGEVYGLRVGLSTNYGQGREFGSAQWLLLPHATNPDLENEGLAVGLTGYYRPEDAELDPFALAAGNVRLCSPDTGDETNHLYGQVICITDGTVEQAKSNAGTTEVQPFVIGGTSQGINMPDNMAFQPRTNNVILHEDAETTFESPHNNDLWSCLQDGADQDLLSDGCARVATLNDLTAEWTGGTFDASGDHFYVSIQHNISGEATILDITGWDYQQSTRVLVALHGRAPGAVVQCGDGEGTLTGRTFRVIQWATGGVGKAAIEGILEHPDLELVGCWVHSESKSGMDVGELIGRDPVGVIASNDIDDVLAIEADCVVYAPLLADPKVVVRILQSGKSISTPVGWVYPDRSTTAKIEAACKEGNATLHGTGIHPGGITEKFPLMLSALSGSITFVRAEEFSDIRTYDAPDVVRDVMLFGAEPDVARTSVMADILGHGFRQSVHMVADTLGFDLDPELRTVHEVAVATAPIDSSIGVIEPGLVAGQRFRWEGLVGGEPVISARVNWLMGEHHLDPAWAFGPERERFEIEVVGDPSITAVFHGFHPDSVATGLARNDGIVATAMHCVNAVPYVCEAAPGIKTYLELPLIAGRAAK